MALADVVRATPPESGTHTLHHPLRAIAAFFVGFAHLFADAQRRRAAFLRGNPHLWE